MKNRLAMIIAITLISVGASVFMAGIVIANGVPDHHNSSDETIMDKLVRLRFGPFGPYLK